MKFKCQYCDPTVKRGQKPVKSVDTETDSFVKLLTGKYYHESCYREYLSKKNFTEEEVEEKIDEIKDRQKDEVKEMEEKDKFLRYIKERHNGSLSSYFLKKVDLIRKGEDERTDSPVTYFELLEIYQYMQNYLDKATSKKVFKSTPQKMNYELAIIVSNVGDYRAYKQQLKEKQEEEKVTDHSILKMEKAKIKGLPKKKEKAITREDMNDLLL